MTGFRFAPGADRDLAEILEYVGRQSGHVAADRVLLEVFDAATKLSKMPRMGRPWIGHVRRPLRVWIVHRFLIVYAPDSSPLEIVRLLHGARDPDWLARVIPADDTS